MTSITFHFRPPGESVSIENVFRAPIRNLREHFEVRLSQSPSSGATPPKIVWNMIRARLSAGQINHVTGDLHYLCLALPKRGLVLTIHDCGELDRFKGFKRWVYRLLWYDLPIRKSSVVVFVSRFTMAEVLRNFPHAATKSTIIHNSVGPEFESRVARPSPTVPTALVVGTKPNKNLPRIISAVTGLDLNLRIIGRLETEQIAQLKAASVMYSNESDITASAMVEEYAAATFLLFPSLYEGFGLPIIEAQAGGCAVITSRAEPMMEVAGNGAHFVNPLDVNDIRSSILIMLSDKYYRENLVRIGFENASRFNERTIYELYRKLYEQLR